VVDTRPIIDDFTLRCAQLLRKASVHDLSDNEVRMDLRQKYPTATVLQLRLPSHDSGLCAFRFGFDNHSLPLI
jgi:hypothetical protein